MKRMFDELNALVTKIVQPIERPMRPLSTSRERR